MTRDEVSARVREILVSDFRIPAAKVTDEASFRGTLGMDSLDAVDLVYLLGKAFAVPAEVESFRELHTVGKVTDYLVGAVEGRAAPVG
jgi:acyl carrier protein